MGNKPVLKLETIVATMPGYFYWKDRRGKYLGCNNEVARFIYGTVNKKSRVIGKTDHDFFDKATADILVKNDQHVMQLGKPCVFEETVISPQGKQVVCITNKIPLKDENGHIIGVLGFSVNINNQKNREKSLLKAKEKSEKGKRVSEIISSNIISNLPGHVFWEDLEGRFLGCNDQQAKSIGLQKAEDLIDKTIWDIAEMLQWDKSMIKQVRKNDLKVMRTGKILNVEESARWSDGSTRIYLSRKAPLKDENGKCIGLLGLAFDITDRKEMENNLVRAKQEAEQANLAKSDFIANISHDIRTPLHAIIGTAELLKLKPYLPEQKEYLDAIVQSGETLLKLIENVLDFTKVEQDSMNLVEEPIDLLSLIRSTLAAVKPQAHAKGVGMILNFPEDFSLPLLSNADALRRILLNLLGNAAKFTNQGEIVLSVEIENVSLHSVTLNLSVKDSGIGIPSEKLPYVFDRFYRINPSFKGKYTGAGLGLAITKKLVEALKGKITVESCLEVGTKFTCTLPFKINHAHSSLKEPTPTNLHPGKLSILLVEDMPLIQKFSIDVLEMLGCQVTLAASAAEAVELAKNRFDLILLDLGLPDDDGLNVAKKIRTYTENLKTPIVALTAHATDQIKMNCFNAGINDFLAKPASYKTLVECLSKYAI